MAAPPLTWSPPFPSAPGFEHLMIPTSGVRMHVAAIGEGEPVLMLHGMPEHWWQWHQIAPVVAASGYRVYCPDLRGSGWTEADSPQIDRLSRMRDVLELLDVLEIERTHVVSHDMGVLTAMQLSYEHPERVGRAVQLSVWPAFFVFRPALIPAFLHLPAFLFHRRGADLGGTFSTRYAAQPMSPETRAAHLAQFQRPEVDAAVRPLTRRLVLSEAMRMLTGVYRRRRLTVCTLVVFGSQDRPTTPDLLKRICRDPGRYADCIEFAHIEGAAHFLTDDQPEAVARLILDWIGRATE